MVKFAISIVSIDIYRNCVFKLLFVILIIGLLSRSEMTDLADSPTFIRLFLPHALLNTLDYDCFEILI